MGNLNYLMAAYLVFWLGTLVLIGSLWRRQVNLRRRLRALEEMTRRVTEGPAKED
jgi:CcmD family protein